MPSFEHDNADDHFGQRSAGPREGVVLLEIDVDERRAERFTIGTREVHLQSEVQH
jgi:hypothetical protein